MLAGSRASEGFLQLISLAIVSIEPCAARRPTRQSTGPARKAAQSVYLHVRAPYRMVTLVLLPGLDGTGLLFADFVAALGPDAKTIVVSYPTDLPLGYDELEPIARSFLPQDEPFFLLAESFSRPIAIAIAASSPPGMLGLVLCCSFARNPMPAFAPFRFALGAAPVRALPLALLGFFVLGRFATPALRAALAQPLALVAPAVLRARARAALSIDLVSLLPQIKLPVLYLRAGEDRIVSKASCDLVSSLLPQTAVVQLSAPHFLLQVQPKLAAAAVTEFIGAAVCSDNPVDRTVGNRRRLSWKPRAASSYFYR